MLQRFKTITKIKAINWFLLIGLALSWGSTKMYIAANVRKIGSCEFKWFYRKVHLNNCFLPDLGSDYFYAVSHYLISNKFKELMLSLKCSMAWEWSSRSTVKSLVHQHVSRLPPNDYKWQIFLKWSEHILKLIWIFTMRKLVSSTQVLSVFRACQVRWEICW